MVDYRSFTVRETRMGDVRIRYVCDPWPEHVLLSPELAERHRSDDGARFEFQNGKAVYKKTGEDNDGNWECRLVSSEFEPPPPLVF